MIETQESEALATLQRCVDELDDLRLRHAAIAANSGQMLCQYQALRRRADYAVTILNELCLSLNVIEDASVINEVKRALGILVRADMDAAFMRGIDP